VLNAALNRDVKVGDEHFVIAKLPLLEDENDKVDWLMRKLSVSFPRKDEIMKVSVTTKNPVHSAAIVTAVTEANLTEVVETERKERDKRISELRGIQIAKAQEVKDALNDLRKMARNLGTSETETLNLKQQNTLAELANYRSELIRTQFDLNRMNADIASLKAVRDAEAEQSVSDIEIQITCQTDPLLRELGSKLVLEQEQEDIYRDAMAKSSKSRSAQMAMSQLGRVKRQFDIRMEQLRDELTKKKRGELERDIKKYQAQIDVAKQQYAATHDDVDRLRKEADEFGVSSIDMQMRRAANTTSQRSLDSITSELETLSVEAKTAPRVSILQLPEPPKNEASYMIRLALTGMASALGFCMPFFGVVIWDLQSNRINGAADVTDQLGLPVIGSVPRIPLRILHHQGVPKKGHQSWQLRLTESVDGISARLLRQAETEQRRVVMVTSAVNGEGKTTLSAQLAMSLARAGRRTLLVDFDLRQPTFDEVFGLPKAPGLSEILRNECDLANCIHATGTENLSVLTAGCWDRFALSALANNCVASMFKELREDYEFVIVDTSPILPIADTRFVSQYVDSVVLCIFRDVSQAPRIRAACEILEAFGVRTVEAVVTGVTDNLGGKRLGYYQPVETAAS
jgi:capsular exopolysaccharide synthesis family protein